MVDWHSELVQLQCFETIVILAWLTIGFVLREQIATARFDWEVLTGKRERKWSQAIYLFVKVVWWVYVALNIVLVYTFNEIDCNTTMWVLEAFMGLMNVSCSILLACRTVCLYQGTARKVVTNTLIIFTLGLVAAWGQGVNSITTVWFPGAGKPWTTGMCVWTAVRTDYCVKYIVTIVFDLTVLMLTVYGVMRIEGFTTKIGQTLTSQGIVYFVVTCVVNALITGFTIAQLNPIMCLIVSMPCSGIAVTASTRLYLELAEGGRPSRPTKTNHAHEECSFGNNLTSVTLNGTVVDKRKSSLGGMRSKGSWASGLSLDVLANSTAPSSLFADTYTPTAPHEQDSQILRQQSIPRKPVPHGSQLFAVEEDVERAGTPAPAIDSDMARSSLAGGGFQLDDPRRPGEERTNSSASSVYSSSRLAGLGGGGGERVPNAEGTGQQEAQQWVIPVNTVSTPTIIDPSTLKALAPSPTDPDQSTPAETLCRLAPSSQTHQDEQLLNTLAFVFSHSRSRQPSA